MSTPYDLVTLAAASAELSASLPADVASLPAVISAASRAVMRYTGRRIILSTFDEVHDGKGYSELLLREYPVIGPLQRLAVNPTTVLTVLQTDASTNQRALASLATMGDPDNGLSVVGLTLQRQASGVTTTSGFPFNQPPALTLAATASTGGSLSAGTYLIAYSLVTAGGESVVSPTVSVVAPASGLVAVTLPGLPANATGMNVYATAANGSTLTRQNGSTPVTAGTYSLSSAVAGASPASATNVTLSDLAASVNGLGSGWTAAAAQGYGLRPTGEFRPSQGAQNALAGTGGPGAAFPQFVTDVGPFDVDERTGRVRLRGQSYDPVFALMNASGGGPLTTFPPGFQNIRATYAAGYATVPYDVQQAVLVTVRDWITDLQKVRIFKSETFKDYSYEFFDRQAFGLPLQAKGILAQWRSYRRS